MDANEYRAAGYRVSLQVSQAEIDRAEREVTEAYVAKVAPSFDAETTTVKACVMSLASILLIQRHAVATRAGGKVKQSPSMSDNAEPTQGDFDNADRLLRAVSEVKFPSRVVDDICGLYYRRKFLGL